MSCVVECTCLETEGTTFQYCNTAAVFLSPLISKQDHETEKYGGFSFQEIALDIITQQEVETTGQVFPNSLIQGDCMEVMPFIADKSIDAIICDLPYGSTALAWDNIIPLDQLWSQYRRIIKNNGSIVLFGAQPFASMIVMSNLKWFKHEWVWVKNTSSGMMNAGKSPMRRHESILVFGGGRLKFNPQMVIGSETSRHHAKSGYSYRNKSSRLYDVDGGVPFVWSEFVNPHTVLPCDSVGNRDSRRVHSTQKPIPLIEYLVRTYTDEGDLVLDNCAGSFTSAVACDNTIRRWICIEQEEKYCQIGRDRIEKNRAEIAGRLPI